jgi:UDP-2-acetamido-2,6-beta-L-arabino-hexul-4-ose reductase
MKNIGITGSKGFIGKHLLMELKKRGLTVSVFDLPENDLLDAKENNLKKFVRENGVIVHAAAINRGTDLEVISGSVAATYNLVSAMKKFKSRAKLVFLSSIQAETETLYGQSKKLAEIMLEDFSKQNKSPVSILRLTNVFGEGCKPFYNSVVATFCHQATKGEKLAVDPKSKNRKMNLVYIGDLVKMISDEIFIKRAKNFYFKRVSAKNLITVGDLAKLVISFKNINSSKIKGKFNDDLYKTYLSYK